MSAFELAVLKVLVPRLSELRTGAVDTIISGRCVDHSEYRYSAGYIKALDDVKIICEQAIEDIQKT